VQKAAQRLKMTEADIRDTLMKKLFSVAYKCIRSGKLYVEDESQDMEELCQSGFVSRELVMKKFRRQKRFAFPHKTMAEFFAALYLIHLEKNEQESWIKEIEVDSAMFLAKFIMGVSQADKDLLKNTAIVL
jgi:hypothetical protein